MSAERYPGHSMPALVAAQAAGRQGGEALDAFHFGLFRTFLVENRDISEASVLEEVALRSGLDVDRFQFDLKDSRLKEAVYAEHLEAVDHWKAEAVPTIIVGEKRIEGAALPAVYEAALARPL